MSRCITNMVSVEWAKWSIMRGTHYKMTIRSALLYAWFNVLAGIHVKYQSHTNNIL